MFESDNQMTLARRYGEGLTLGRPISRPRSHSEPHRRRVSVDDVKRVAAEFLLPQRSVTGMLTPTRRKDGEPGGHRNQVEARNAQKWISMPGKVRRPLGLRHALGCSVCLLPPDPMLGSAPASAADGRGDRERKGIKAWLVEEHSVPLVAIRFAFAGGATQDPPGKEGLAGMVPTLLTGGGRRPCPPPPSRSGFRGWARACRIERP